MGMTAVDLAEKISKCFGVVNKNMSKKMLLAKVINEMAEAQLDLDKTGDIDAAYYYSGLVDAYEYVALLLAPLTDKDTFLDLLGKHAVEKAS